MSTTKKVISQERFEEQQEAFRHAFLAALDAATAQACSELNIPTPRYGGATDGDLPRLLVVVDRHFRHILLRAGVAVSSDGEDTAQ